jgi:hypothetical protein
MKEIHVRPMVHYEVMMHIPFPEDTHIMHDGGMQTSDCTTWEFYNRPHAEAFMIKMMEEYPHMNFSLIKVSVTREPVSLLK